MPFGGTGWRIGPREVPPKDLVGAVEDGGGESAWHFLLPTSFPTLLVLSILQLPPQDDDGEAVIGVRRRRRSLVAGGARSSLRRGLSVRLFIFQTNFPTLLVLFSPQFMPQYDNEEDIGVIEEEEKLTSSESDCRGPSQARWV